MPGNEKEYKYWGKRANAHEESYLYIVGNTINQEVKDWLVNQFKDTNVVLELGCGSGNCSQMIATGVKRLTATDLAPEMAEQAKKRLGRFSNVKVRREDCYSTSFEDNMFDAVLLVNLLHIVKDPVAVMRESHRVLKHDGKAVVVDVTGYGMPFFSKMALGFRYMKKWRRPAPYNRSYGPEELTEIVKEAGFTVEEARLIGQDTKAACLRGVAT